MTSGCCGTRDAETFKAVTTSTPSNMAGIPFLRAHGGGAAFLLHVKKLGVRGFSYGLVSSKEFRNNSTP
jgi:hypothetical protein